MRIVETRPDGSGVCDLDGIRHEVDLSLVDAKLGDFVIVHAGFAIETLDIEEADARIAMFEQLAASQEMVISDQ